MKPSEVTDFVEDSLDLDLPAIIWGPPGVGKSDIVAQVAKRRGLELRDVRMAQMDPTDIKGFPAPNTTKNVMKWLTPDFLPTDKKSQGILFLDELPSAPTAVQASGYQLVLNRAVGDYKLPPGWRILAAGNRESDRSVVHRMPSALANRFLHATLEPHLGEWIDYAIDNDFDPMVIAFLRFRPDYIFKFDPANASQAFPTPRSWAYVNRAIKQKLPLLRESQLVQGTVGVGPALEFAGFVQIARQLPDITEIAVSPDTAPVPEEPAALHAVTMMVAMATTGSNFAKFMKYIERVPTEFQVVFVRDVLRRDRTVAASPVYTAWGIKNDQVIT